LSPVTRFQLLRTGGLGRRVRYALRTTLRPLTPSPRRLPTTIASASSMNSMGLRSWSLYSVICFSFISQRRTTLHRAQCWPCWVDTRIDNCESRMSNATLGEIHSSLLAQSSGLTIANKIMHNNITLANMSAGDVAVSNWCQGLLCGPRLEIYRPVGELSIRDHTTARALDTLRVIINPSATRAWRDARTREPAPKFSDHQPYIPH
jgi:hypothetical protein